jgi:hypothetical protein
MCHEDGVAKTHLATAVGAVRLVSHLAKAFLLDKNKCFSKPGVAMRNCKTEISRQVWREWSRVSFGGVVNMSSPLSAGASGRNSLLLRADASEGRIGSGS